MGLLDGIMGAIPVVGGLYTGVKGIIDNGKANSALKAANNMPQGQYNIQPEFVQNYNRAGLNSLSGIPDAQRAFAMQNIARSGANALASGNLTRNSSALVGQVQQQQNDAYNQLAAQDAQQRMANQQQLYNAATALGDQKVAQNQYQNYLDQKNRDRALGLAQQQKAAAQANITNGFSSAIGSALGLATGGLSSVAGSALKGLSGLTSNGLSSAGLGSMVGQASTNIPMSLMSL
jgi:hypothetical protein